MPHEITTRDLTNEFVLGASMPIDGELRIYQDRTQPQLYFVIDSVAWWGCASDGAWQEEMPLRIGNFPELLPHEAREKVKFLMTGDITVGEMFTAYLERHVRIHNSARIYKELTSAFRLYYTEIGGRPAQILSKQEVEDWVTRLAGSRGQATAGKQLRMFNACFEWAIQAGLVYITVSPTKGIKKFKDRSRSHRCLDLDESSRLQHALEQTANKDHADIIWLALWTSQRKANILSMTWQHIHMQEAEWIIPGDDAETGVKTKSGKTHRVTLTALAMEILERRRAQLPLETVYVFPCAESKSGHIEDATKTWYSVRKKANLQNFRFHDLRHSGASAMANTGASAFAIQQSLQHASVTTSERYVHPNKKLVREAMETAQKWLRSGVKTIRTENHKLLPVIAQPERPFRSPTPNPKNAGASLSPSEQVLLEAKILTTLRKGGNTKSAFYRSVGPHFALNSIELDRVLREMEAKELIHSYRQAPDWHILRYAINGTV